MSVKDDFEKHFSEANLINVFEDHIVYSGGTGIDNLDQYAFRPTLRKQVEIISRKAIAGTYKFTKYKLKLVSKGRGKTPREISLPAVRDRIALRALCNFFMGCYKNKVQQEIPQKVIKLVKEDIESKKYDGYIKLDVSNFYPSILHEKLMARISQDIAEKEIVNLVKSSLETPTVERSDPEDKPSEKGVPQGLAVSNVLSSIYLIDIDKEMQAKKDIKYYRYVDDILILCDRADAPNIANEVIHRFEELGLQIYEPKADSDKSSIGGINDHFGYLGYQFGGGVISVRQASIERLRASLVALFTSYRHSKKQSPEFLLWRLNLRITGCVFQNTGKGWLFFFSEINHESLLHTFDNYVKKLVMRFGVDITPKKFVRAFKEITKNRYETNYIPNFDTYTMEQMRYTLSTYFGVNVSLLEDEEVKYAFNKRINKQVKVLLVDIQSFASG